MIEIKVGFSIGCDPPIYVEEGGVIPVANVSKIRFTSFSHQNMSRTELDSNRSEITKTHLS